MFDRRVYRYILLATFLTLMTGTVFYHLVEKFSWIDAYYFSVVTLATVGYGDLVPRTDVGKLFTTLYIFIGVGIITTFITYSLKKRAHKMSARQEHRKENKQ